MDHLRHSGIFNASRFPITLIGAGGIGAITGIVLAKMGVPVLNVYDGDTVDPVNIATQFYRTSDIGSAKPFALKQIIEEFSDDRLKNWCIHCGGWLAGQPPSFRAARAAAKIISLSVEGEDVW